MGEGHPSLIFFPNRQGIYEGFENLCFESIYLLGLVSPTNPTPCQFASNTLVYILNAALIEFMSLTPLSCSLHVLEFRDHCVVPGMFCFLLQMENSAVNLHEDLKSVLDYQTHHKLREAQGRSFAEDLNDRVFYWSLGQSIIILMIGVGQVLILRSFFTDKRGSKP